LGRAIGNLLDNAIAAVPEKDGRILVALNRRRRGVQVVISDNGPGMKPGELARALDGYRLGKGNGEGEKRGLGLPLARQLVEAHGGRLDVQSEVGGGTTATITLP
jgi:signal transduction histidine kinase